MIRSYFTIAVRNITKHKLYSFINAFGLSIAIAFCLLIYLYIQDEKSFDQFNQNKDQLFMITERSFNKDLFENGKDDPYSQSAYLPAKLAEVMQEEMPEVRHATRFNSGEGVMKVGTTVFKQGVTYVDSGFFKMFSFPLKSGNANKIFRSSNEAVLTEAVAKKYFGDDQPLGKTFTFDADGEKVFVVAAVIETPPANSSIEFDMLLPIENRPFFNQSREKWGNFGYPTFVQINPETDINKFRVNFEKLADKYLHERFEKRRERQNIPAKFAVGDFHLVNLSDVHLNTKVSWPHVSDPKYALILGGIALLILIIACINYISLALTTSASRRIEVGIRKVVGAAKRQLVYQFAFESITLSLIAMIAGIILTILILPVFNSFTGKGIEITITSLAKLISVSFLLSVFVGALAGSYPSVFLSGFLPAAVLKGRFTSRVSAGFTKPLVILQFALSAFLIISSVIMYQQMRYVTTKDLGYNQQQIMVIPTHVGWNIEADKIVARLRNKLSEIAEVKNVTGTSSSFNQGWSRYGYNIKGELKTAFVYRVDPEYVKLLDIKLIDGRNFDETRASDSTAVIVNEALVKDMGWKKPLEEHLNWKEDSTSLGSEVIGVIKDYHFLSLEQEIEPLFLSIDKNLGFLTTAMVKISPENIPATVEKIRATWSEVNPGKPFEYTFVDEDVARQYERYQQWMNITGLSTLMAILIASLGLFGLAGINAVNRTKEIGIRKVMGAEVMNIFMLLNKQYFYFSIIAFIIATPVSYYVMNRWLSDFKFHIAISWQIFAVSSIAGLLVAIFTVSYHAVRASRINPAETLKHE
jgi:putative ABC transport system permease protein